MSSTGDAGAQAFNPTVKTEDHTEQKSKPRKPRQDEE